MYKLIYDFASKEQSNVLESVIQAIHFCPFCSLVEKVESDAILPSLCHIIVESRRVPAVAALPLVRLLAQRWQWFPQAVSG